MASDSASSYKKLYSSKGEFLKFHSESEEDAESLASLETDDGVDHPPERIIADQTDLTGLVWYLVKWEDCDILRSSWEGRDFCKNHPEVLKRWLVEKERILRGEVKPLDLEEFKKQVLEVEDKERQRRRLRRLKRKIQN